MVGAGLRPALLDRTWYPSTLRTPPMPYDPQIHRRRSIRMPEYDYTKPGAYFFTSCVKNRAMLFGTVVGNEMRLNASGEHVWSVWRDLPNHFEHVALDAFVVMPNHIHGIIWLKDNVTVDVIPADSQAIPIVDSPGESSTRRARFGVIVGALKSFSARRVNAGRQTRGAPLWQRDYHEHVIRNEESLNRIRRYISENPARWAFDRENPGAVAPEPADIWRELADGEYR